LEERIANNDYSILVNEPMKSQKLREVCEKIVDCEHKTAPTQEAGYPSIRTPNIGRGRLILDEVNRVSEEVYNEWIRRAVPKGGDLILAREAPVGNVAIIPKDLNVCLGQRTVLLRSDRSKVVPEYLVYLLLGDEVQAKFNAYASGATVPHLNVRDIRNLKLPSLPPLPTQRKIAAILSAYDDLIENNSRRIAILEEMAQLLYREWFVHFRFPGHEDVAMVEFDVEDLDINGDFPHLTTVPSGWEIRRLGDLAKRMRRGADPQELPEETPYIGLGHMPKESIALSEWGSASETKSRKYRFKRGEILFGRIRPYFHKVGVAPVDGIGSTDIIVITPKSPESFALILGCVSSKRFVDYATQTSSGTKMPRAKWKILVDYPVLIPPKPILDQYSALIEDIVAQINNLIFRNRTLRQTRDLLLPRLVSGELDVADLPIAMEAVDSQ